ncbi:C-X-C chemokine receptor type 3 [Bagarius yarrelli]|uniref:C-X-C chemokine receptor type 3 n=1 Tax=Bagarius yarrelli TaxID=175774 RepID=A0A556V1M9_BAGYA|nr:C-X-C chemokine receptor type 3 [Bagarius yarrelli]
MDCAGADPKSDIEWKLNNALLFYMYKSGRNRKGNSDTSKRTWIEGNILKISPLKSIDSGLYTCKSSSHTLYVASAYVDSSSVFYSGETKLSCDASGDSESTFHWLTPKDQPYAKEKVVTVKPVTLDHAGLWTCQIKDKKQEILVELKVNLNVVGPLITPKKVRISEWDNAELPCFLPSVSGLYITEGSWTHDSPSGVRLPALKRTESGVQWNRTGVNTNKVGFTDQDLKKDFNLTLKKVRISDAGVYVCSLVFEGGKSLSANLTLTVVKNDASAPVTMPTPLPLMADTKLFLSCEIEREGINLVGLKSVRWTGPDGKNYIGKSDRNRYTLSVDKVSRIHSGKWICEINYDVQGRLQAMSNVIILDLTQSPLEPIYAANDTSNFALPCSLSSNVSWSIVNATGLIGGSWSFVPVYSSESFPPLLKLHPNPSPIWKIPTGSQNWLMESKVKNHDLSVKISRVSIKHRGIFTCSLDFKSKTLSSRVQLEVLQVISSAGNGIHEGNTLNLTCTLGHPMSSDLKVNWKAPHASSRDLSHFQSTNLSIRGVEVKDSGKWTCELKKNGTVLTTATIRVKVEKAPVNIWLLVAITGGVLVIVLLSVIAVIIIRRHRKVMKYTRRRRRFCCSFVLGVMGNGLVLVVLCQKRQTWSVTDVFVLHLSVADILLLSTMPLWAVNAVNGWNFSTGFCKLAGALFKVNFYSGIFLLACISLDRYFSVVHAVQMYTRTRPLRVHISCLAVWFFCFLLSIPDLMYLKAENDPRRGTRIECDHHYPSTTMRLTSRVLYHVLGFLLPAVVLLYCYSSVLLRLQRGSQGVQKQRAVRVVLALVIAFFITWTPYNITLLVDTIYSNHSTNINTTCTTTTVLDIALTATSTLGYLHCCVNPVLYAFVGVKFRRHLLDMIKPLRYRLQTRVETVSRKSSVWSADTSQTSAF